MNFNELNKDNFLLFSIENYVNPKTTTQDEFEGALSRFKYVKRWIRKYHESGTINSHLLLNHIIVILNCWQDAAIPMFFFKLEPEYWTYIKSFLVYLNRIPPSPRTILHDIEGDEGVFNILNGI